MSQGGGAGGAAMGDDMDVIPEREMKVRAGGRARGLRGGSPRWWGGGRRFGSGWFRPGGGDRPWGGRLGP